MANPPKTPLYVRQIPGGFFSLVNEEIYPGLVLWVDATNGVDTNNGGPDDPLKTITAAVALCSATKDTILLNGNFTEAVTIPTGCAGLKIRGLGRCPKDTQWGAATDGVCLTVNANYVTVENIYFKPPAYSAGAPAAILLGGANWCTIKNCRFQGQTGSYYAIYSPVCNSDNVHIIGNRSEERRVGKECTG